MDIRTTRKAIAGVLVAMVGAAAIAVPTASAADATDLVISSGSLSSPIVAIGDFGAITLDGTAQTSNATMDAFSVTDGRGTGGGWNVTVQATQFAEHDGTAYVASGKTLPANSLTMAAPTVAANGTSSPEPTITGGPYTLDGGGAIKIASAAADTGMGTYDFTPGASSLTLGVPSSAYAKTYRSDLTVSVVAGP